MPRLLKEGQERKLSLSVAIEPKVLAGVDKNIETLRSWLKSEYGVSDKDLKEISRSYFIRECLTLFSHPECVDIVKSAAALYVGVDTSQTSFLKDKKSV